MCIGVAGAHGQTAQAVTTTQKGLVLAEILQLILVAVIAQTINQKLQFRNVTIQHVLVGIYYFFVPICCHYNKNLIQAKRSYINDNLVLSKGFKEFWDNTLSW